jgi:hypothetical protein
MASIFTKSSIVDTCAAYNVLARESQGVFNTTNRNTTQVVNLVAGETLKVEDNLQIFRINSVMSYALANNECPIVAYNRAADNDHNTYWISGCPTVISSRNIEEKASHILVDFETVYKFQGLYWNIAKDFNNNIKLVEINLK